MIKIDVHRSLIAAVFFSVAVFHPSDLTAAQRELTISHIERDGDNHVRMRVQAYEVEQGKKFPLTTLDRSSFNVIINGDDKNKTNFSLQSFSSDRRTNARAVVWIYDATGVKTVRGLTRSLRTLTSQDFPNFTADYTSVFGVAGGRTIERGTIDSLKTDNILSLQKKLSSNPKGLKPSDISTEPSLCRALNKFQIWKKYGLKTSDQKVVFLLGGSGQHSSEYLAQQNECVEKLNQMSVSIHQVIFASEQRLQERIWVHQEQVIKNGSLFRVINVAGASRALATLQSLLDSEYDISAQLPSESAPLAHQVIIHARYHGDNFTSSSVIIPPAAPLKQAKATQFIQPRPTSAPQKMVAVQNATQLALEGWIEWLLTSFIVGIIVTIRHINRFKSASNFIYEEENSSQIENFPRLLILSGKQRGRLIHLPKISCVLGRSWHCDIRINSKGVQWKHGRIEIKGDKAIVEDLSQGQLFVNGRNIKNIRAIGHGCVIQLGELQLLFQCGDS